MHSAMMAQRSVGLHARVLKEHHLSEQITRGHRKDTDPPHRSQGPSHRPTDCSNFTWTSLRFVGQFSMSLAGFSDKVRRDLGGPAPFSSLLGHLPMDMRSGYSEW